jgi:hypothetical protein
MDDIVTEVDILSRRWPGMAQPVGNDARAQPSVVQDCRCRIPEHVRNKLFAVAIPISVDVRPR